MICINRNLLLSMGMSADVVQSIRDRSRAHDGGGLATSDLFSFGGGGNGRIDTAALEREPAPRKLVLVGMADRYGEAERRGAEVATICMEGLPSGAEAIQIAILVDGCTHPDAPAIATAFRAFAASLVSISIVNLTPHDIVLQLAPGETRTIARSGRVARADELPQSADPLDGLPTTYVAYGALKDLPDPTPGTYYVVSVVTAMAARAAGRGVDDLLTPGQQVRDEAGRVIGCLSLQRVA